MGSANISTVTKKFMKYGYIPPRYIQFMTYYNQSLKNYRNIIERKFNIGF